MISGSVRTVVDEADKQLFASLLETWKVSEAGRENVKTLLTAGRIDEARSIFVGDVLKTYAQAKAVIQGAVDDMAKDVRSEGASMTHVAGAATTLNSLAWSRACHRRGCCGVRQPESGETFGADDRRQAPSFGW